MLPESISVGPSGIAGVDVDADALDVLDPGPRNFSTFFVDVSGCDFNPACLRMSAKQWPFFMAATSNIFMRSGTDKKAQGEAGLMLRGIAGRVAP